MHSALRERVRVRLERGTDWVENVLLGWSTEIVRHPPKSAPQEEVMMRWARELAKGGVKLDPRKFFPSEGPRPFLAAALGGGKDLFLVGAEQEDEQVLRAAAGDGRSLNLRGDELPYGEEVGPLMRLFRQFHGEVRRTPPTGYLGE